MEDMLQMWINLIVETLKYQSDYFKHVTTLSTGSILIIVALVEGVFKSPEGIVFIWLSILGFLVCLVSSVFMMQVIGGFLGELCTPWEPDKRHERQEKIVKTAKTANRIQRWSWVGFLGGIVFLLIFSLINFLQKSKL